jgi:hypothetical protein
MATRNQIEWIDPLPPNALKYLRAADKAGPHGEDNNGREIAASIGMPEKDMFAALPFLFDRNLLEPITMDSLHVTSDGRKYLAVVGDTEPAADQNILDERQKNVLLRIVKAADSNGNVRRLDFPPPGAMSRDTFERVIREIAEIELPNGGRLWGLNSKTITVYKEARDLAKMIEDFKRDHPMKLDGPEMLIEATQRLADGADRIEVLTAIGEGARPVSLPPPDMMRRFEIGRTDQARAAYDQWGDAFIVWARKQFLESFDAWKKAHLSATEHQFVEYLLKSNSIPNAMNWIDTLDSTTDRPTREELYLVLCAAESFGFGRQFETPDRPHPPLPFIINVDGLAEAQKAEARLHRSSPSSIKMPKKSTKRQESKDPAAVTSPFTDYLGQLWNGLVLSTKTYKPNQYAIGLVGIAFTVAIILFVLKKPEVAVVGMVLAFAGMVVLLQFKGMADGRTRSLEGKFLTWVVILVLSAFFVTLFTAYTFGWPPVLAKRF